MPDKHASHTLRQHELPDSNLVKRVQLLGDHHAFKTLVLRHSPKVRGFLTRLCHDKHLADDIAQECFLRAFRHIGSYQPNGQFSSWLLKIAHRCYLQEKRLVARRQAKWEQHEATASINVPPDTPTAEDELDLQNAFTALSEKEVICLTLCYTIGYSHSEIAQISGIPLGSIKTYIKTGKNKLRDQLVVQPQENSND